MSPVPPARVAAAPLKDVAHPAAGPVAPVAPSLPPVAPALPVTSLADVHHPAAVVEVGPVCASEPLPVPEPHEITRTPLTVDGPEAVAKVSMIAGIAPDEIVAPVIAPTPAQAPVTPPVAPVLVTTTMPSPVAAVEVYEDSEIAGGAVTAPVVPLPQSAPTAAKEATVKVADSVRKFAESKGVDLATVRPGKSGRITRKDVEAALADESTSTADDTAEASEAVAAPVPATAEPVEPVESAEVEQPVAAPAPAVDTRTVHIHFDLTSGKKPTIRTSDDLLKLASDALPGLRIVSAAIEFSTTGPVLVAGFDQTAEVTL